MGATDERVDVDKFGRDIERLNNVEAQVDVVSTLDGELRGQVQVDESEITDLLLEFVDVTESNGLKLPRGFGLLIKQSLYFDRYLKILAPSSPVQLYIQLRRCC